MGSASTLHVEGALKHAVAVGKARIVIAICLFITCYIAIGFRLVNLSVAEGEVALPIRSQRVAADYSVSRREVVDRNGVLLASNLRTQSLYANPRQVKDVQKAADAIAQVFPEMDKKSVIDKLARQNSFVWLKRHVHPELQAKMMNMGIPGLYFREEEKRMYPQGDMLAHVLGFVDTDGQGIAGIEKSFDSALKDPDKGEDPMALAIDVRVQDALNNALYTQFIKHSAKGAAGLVMDVNTGEILAMASLPNFDPNNPQRLTADQSFNRATLGVYEMGSTFKTFTMATALDTGTTSLDRVYDATEPIKIGRFSISDFHPEKRPMNVAEIFMHSSNIGTARIADEMGSDRQRDYLKRFGLMSPLPIEVPERGDPLLPKDGWGRLTTMTVSYGHGMAVTPVHVAAALAAAVNGGIYHAPTLLKQDNPEGVRIIKDSTSDKMRRLLRLVVEHGTGTKADAEGYVVGGKTGTAEKIGIGHYDTNRLVTSFAGAFPMQDPRYVVLVTLDEPKATADTYGFATAGWTAAPAVSSIVKAIAPVLGVMPVDVASPDVQRKLQINVGIKGVDVAAGEDH